MGDKTGKKSFNDLIGSVRKMPQDRVKPYRPKVKPIPTQRLTDDENVMRELLEADDETSSLDSGDELDIFKERVPT